MFANAHNDELRITNDELTWRLVYFLTSHFFLKEQFVFLFVLLVSLFLTSKISSCLAFSTHAVGAVSLLCDKETKTH